MAGSPTAADDVADAYVRFTSGVAGPFSGTEHNLIYRAVAELLEEDELEAYVPLEMSGASWVLIVRSTAGAALLRLLGEGVECRYLGALRGSYREQWSETETGLTVTAIFDDVRLPGGTLRLDVPAPPPDGSVFDRDLPREQEMLSKIRKRLRTWAIARD